MQLTHTQKNLALAERNIKHTLPWFSHLLRYPLRNGPEVLKAHGTTFNLTLLFHFESYSVFFV